MKEKKHNILSYMHIHVYIAMRVMYWIYISVSDITDIYHFEVAHDFAIAHACCSFSHGAC